MIKESLQLLYAEHAGKVSDKWSLYLREYNRLFEPWRDAPVRLLEIGIQNGGSLEIWSKYFSNASCLVGCDINADCGNLGYDDPRIGIIIGDANESETREKVIQRSSQFDIVIDDGSHRSSDIVKSFALYFPHVAEGGIFVAEDLHCSYWNQFEGGLFDPYSSISFFKRLADVVNYEHWGIEKARTDILQGFCTKYGCEIDAKVLAQIHSVEFINSMCVIRKAFPAMERGLGCRFIAGTIELVVSGHRDLHNKPYQFDEAFEQSGNPWTAMAMPPDEAFQPTIQELGIARQENAALAQQHATLEQQNAILQQRNTALEQKSATLEQSNSALAQRNSALEQQNLMLEQQFNVQERQVGELNHVIAGLRNSTSWRITAPLRRAATGVKTITDFLLQGGGLSAPAAATAVTSASTVLGSGMPAAAARDTSLRKMIVQHGHGFYRSHMKHTRLGRMIGQQILRRGLINPTELQISALSHDSLVVQRAQDADADKLETDVSLSGFHLSLPLNLQVSEALVVRPRINVLLPSLQLKNMSGGPNTALLLAALLAEKGELIRLIACDIAMEGEAAALLFSHMDGLLQRPVARERIELVDACDRARPIAIGAHDLFFATAWWTAQIAKYAVKKTACKTFIYLIQDFEPILHEGSTYQARALETYDLPHIPVINTRLLLDHLVRERAGSYADHRFAEQALWFEPALDRNYYFSDADQKKSGGKKVLLFYARPTVARRNLFEVGLVALRLAVASGAIDKETWEVWAMGERLSPVALGNGMFLNPLPWMSFDDYARRVRTADLMLSLMLSPHPSYPPLEMAASGKLVVTNSFSVKTAERIREISPNILVAAPTAESVAAALENAAGRINAGLQSPDPSGRITLPCNWDESLGAVVPEILQRIAILRKAPPEPGIPFSSGFPATPKNAYENYRRDCLTRRRNAANYAQKPGLLSFVTSAYNTDPAFLEALGSSVFLQDGGVQFEWLILDNGSSSQGTRLMLQELARHPAVRLERVEQNLGIIGGMRFCLEHARGRYILPLDSDDLIEPDCVHVLTRFIEENGYPPLLYTDEDKLGDGRFGSPYFKPDWDPVLFLHSCYIAHLCAIDRGLALQLGLYTDKTSEGCHDWDSFIRFMNAGHVPRHIPEALYSWRVHSESTSGNIASKSYITDSHRSTLERFLNRLQLPDIELTDSPLFNYNVDWWFRRKRTNPRSMRTIIVGVNNVSGAAMTPDDNSMRPPLALRPGSGIKELFSLIEADDSELIHLLWHDVLPDDDEWRWDAMALLELFADAVMVGGMLHDGTRIVDGPRVFGFGDGFDSPEAGRPLADPGYGANMWKPRTVSAISPAHCVIRTSFLRKCKDELLGEGVPIAMLGLWLGGQALESGTRVVYSPFMHARASVRVDNAAIPCAKAHFLSRFWARFPDSRVYSPRLALDRSRPYEEADPEENRRHLFRLQSELIAYPRWLNMHVRQRAAAYPLPGRPSAITLITTVYEKTDLSLLDALGESVIVQAVKAAQWIIVAHGPIPAENLRHIASRSAARWNASLIVEPQALGIMGAMRRGLVNASGNYIVPVDADDLLAEDAIQILTNAIARFDSPDMIYSDEDQLVDGTPALPYLRSCFDPVLNLDSSYIWHLCAFNRQRALALELYTDPGATWCHDWDSVMRVANGGGRIEHVPEVLYHWRQHSGSTTNNAQGDSRSLDSVRHVLERHIARTANPHRFQVEDWPKSRGARELYIARRPVPLPQLVWMGDLAMAPAASCASCDEDAILVFCGNGVIIESQQVFAEAARLLELHPHVGAIGGLVTGWDGLVIDSCYVRNQSGQLERPWIGKSPSDSGPYALALKTQSVAVTGNSLGFFRVSAFRQAGMWPLGQDGNAFNTAASLCSRLAANGWTVAFSPLMQARAASLGHGKHDRCGPPAGMHGERHALTRYGIAQNYRE